MIVNILYNKIRHFAKRVVQTGNAKPNTGSGQLTQKEQLKSISDLKFAK